MDGIYRKGRYREIIKKLNILQGAEVVDSGEDKYSILQDEVNMIIESLRNRGDQSNAQIHYVLLIIPLLIVLAWHSYSFDAYLLNGLFILLVVAYIIGAHLRMTLVIKNSHKSEKENFELPGNTRAFILTKMNYLEKAMDIKKSRLLLVSFFYIVFFPVFLVRLHTVAISSMAFDSISMAFVVAYLIGGALWYFYFNRSFEIYDDIETSLELIRGNL